MTEQEMKQCLDPTIQHLLAEIETYVPVKFTQWEKDFYACQVHKDCNGAQKEAEVFYKEPLQQAKIAHELLHAKTSLILGDNAIMFGVENQCQLFQYFMSPENASNIVNVCEHVIFFPDYLEMGYSENDSFEQPTDLDKRMEELADLENHGLKENGHFSAQKVFLYLSLVFSFLFYPNEARFQKEIKKLRRINIPLFSVMNKLKRDCTDVKITPDNKDYIQHAYFEFANKLNEWMNKAFEGAVFAPPQQ